MLTTCQIPSFGDLAPMFRPARVALIGATDRAGSVGRAVLENLRGFSGHVCPINPKHREVLGARSWPRVSEVGEPIDLAVVVTPAATVPGVIAECVACGVRAAVIISAGFKEAGEAGRGLEDEILAEARRDGLRIIGPNCLGIMAPHIGLNATFASAMARPGRVAFLSQSGALCTAILDWSFSQHVGFSAFVSVGSMLDVGWGDLIRHFGDDPATGSIVMYMESVGDADAFLDAARLVAGKKPIVVIKVGRTAAAARAAASHTGAMTGSDAVLDAALRRVGVLRVDTIEEVFDMAEVLSKQPLPAGPRLGIVTNAGGPGALAVDAVVHAGGSVAELEPASLAALDAVLPPHWSHANPVDVLGDADAGRYEAAFRIVANDPQVDGVLAVLTPQSMTQPDSVARAFIAVADGSPKPMLASWMGGDAVTAARDVLNAAGLATYDYPDGAARAFQFMWQRHQRLRWLDETNRLACLPPPALPDACRVIIDAVRREGRTLLTEVEAKLLLNGAGVAVVKTQAASTEEEAVAAAEAIGFPVVLKLLSMQITHKTDVGGVQLNLPDGAAVREAWRRIRQAVPPEAFQGASVQRMISRRGVELIVGSSTDAQFGPVLLFGAGGTMVEVFRDFALALPPLSPSIADAWIAETRINQALLGVRGQPPANRSVLIDALVKFSALVRAAPEIDEIDINPLVATPDGAIALDARVVLHPA